MNTNEPPDLPVRPEWLAQHREAALEPDLPIIDAHHHLWDRPAWRYMFADFLKDLDNGHKIAGTVFVQCRAMHRAGGPELLRPVGETEFINGVAAMSASGAYGPAAVCAGIVGYANLGAGAAVEDVLEAHVRAGNGRFRGVRQISAWDDEPETAGPANAPASGLLGSRAFREGFKCLAPLQLSFDAWLFSPQIDELAELAKAFPETTIILDHVGTPLGVGRYRRRQAEVFAAWRTSIQALARYPNVAVKLGGLGMRLNGFDLPSHPQPPSSETLADLWRPYFETCIDAFTPARCMFESNFPVDKVSYSYGVFWNACKRIASAYTDDERTNLFSGAAARLYRLDLPPY
jgi:L-fuconolactonase